MQKPKRSDIKLSVKCDCSTILQYVDPGTSCLTFIRYNKKKKNVYEYSFTKLYLYFISNIVKSFSLTFFFEYIPFMVSIRFKHL